MFSSKPLNQRLYQLTKNYGTAQNVRVSIDRENGDVAVLMRRDVVEEVEDEFTEVSP